MGRSLRLIGLPEEAEDYLREYQAKKIATAYVEYFYTDTPLFTYRLNDGRVVSEVEQYTYWCSGPVVFHQLIEQPKGNVLFKHDEVTDDN